MVVSPPSVVMPFSATGIPAVQPGAFVTRHWGYVTAVNTTNNTITVLVDGIVLSKVPVRAGYAPVVNDIAVLDVLGTGDVSQSYVTAVGALSASLASAVAAAFTAGLTTTSHPGDAVSDGSSSSPARGDHKHGREAWPVGATVATVQSTASTAYTDLGTVGPSVTLVTGASAFVFINTQVQTAAANFESDAAVAVSGATTIPAAAGNIVCVEVNSNGASYRSTNACGVITGLTPGSNTFTLKYKVNGSTGTWAFRNLIVFPGP